MELKWLEDLLSVVEYGHFAKAAEARHITQSALSRRIKALESWVGSELLDRSEHPVRPTPAGQTFLPTARDIVREAYSARDEVSKYDKLAETGMTIASLHTLALFFVPQFVSGLKDNIGPVEASVVAETRTIDEYLNSLYDGSTDFFICYSHPAYPFNIDRSAFPSLTIGKDVIKPYILGDPASHDFDRANGPAIPYIEYGGTSFLSRVVRDCLIRTPFRHRLKPQYKGTLSESIATAALSGFGLAWLPESLVLNSPRTAVLQSVNEDWGTEVSISIFRSAKNDREIVHKTWTVLQAV